MFIGGGIVRLVAIDLKILQRDIPLGPVSRCIDNGGIEAGRRLQNSAVATTLYVDPFIGYV